MFVASDPVAALWCLDWAYAGLGDAEVVRFNRFVPTLDTQKPPSHYTFVQALRLIPTLTSYVGMTRLIRTGGARTCSRDLPRLGLPLALPH